MNKAATTFLVLALLGIEMARGIFVPPDLEQVPVARLQTNLEAQVAAAPQNFQAHYALARVHAMAYSLKAGEVPVDKRNGQVYPGDPSRGDFPPSKVNQVGDTDLREKAQKHLAAAVDHYRKAVAIQEDHWPSRLGLAWALQEQGARTNALAEFRKTLALAWEKDQAKDHFLHHIPTEEIANYLLPLLDRQRDAEEIAAIKNKVVVLRKKPRAVTPLLIPLTAQTNLHALIDAEANVLFDLDGSDLRRRWGWPTPLAGWLVFDPPGRGHIRSGLQLFGNVTFWIFWENGYQALATLDDNADGELRGSELRDLAIWQDLNQNGVSEPAEVRRVSSWGIAVLACKSQIHSSGIPFSPRGVIFDDGSARPTYDAVVPVRR